MLLGNSELDLGVALCRLFFFKAFLLSPPSVAGRTHKAAFWRHWGEFLLAAGSVRWLCCTRSRQQMAPFGPVGRLIQKKPTPLWKIVLFGRNACLVYNRICHTEDKSTYNLPLLAKRQTAYKSNYSIYTHVTNSNGSMEATPLDVTILSCWIRLCD